MRIDCDDCRMQDTDACGDWRHHEDVQPHALAAERHHDLAPVALRLLARAGLEALLRQRPGPPPGERAVGLGP